MAKFDLHHDIFGLNAIRSGTWLGDLPRESEIIDMFNYQALELVINLSIMDPGTVGATYTLSVEHGDDALLADATPVPSELLLGGDPLADPVVTPEEQASWDGTNGNEIRRIGYVGKKRYVRATITPAGSTSVTFSMTAIQHQADSLPTDEN